MYDNIAVHQKVMSRSAFNMTMGATTPPTIDDRFENMIISSAGNARKAQGGRSKLRAIGAR